MKAPTSLFSTKFFFMALRRYPSQGSNAPRALKDEELTSSPTTRSTTNTTHDNEPIPIYNITNTPRSSVDKSRNRDVKTIIHKFRPRDTKGPDDGRSSRDLSGTVVPDSSTKLTSFEGTTTVSEGVARKGCTTSESGVHKKSADLGKRHQKPNLFREYERHERKAVLQAERVSLESQLRSLKIEDKAVRRALKYGRITAESYEAFNLYYLQERDAVAQRLFWMTNREYVEMIWCILDKTDFASSTFHILTNMLTSFGLKKVEKTKDENNKWNKRWSETIRIHYEVYEPKEYRGYLVGRSLEREANAISAGPVLKGDLRVWCPVLKTYQTTTNGLRKLSHILPRNLGNQNICAMLGYDPDAEMLYSKENLIYLDGKIEERLDSGDITFVPVDGGRSDPIEYKLLVINQELLPLHVREGKRWRDLNGQQLEWKNKNRPAKRHLYLHNVLAFLRATLTDKPGCDKLEKLIFTENAYATPEAFVRSDMLRWLSQNVSNNLPAEWSRHSFDIGPTETCRPSGEYLARRVADVWGRISMLPNAEAKLPYQEFDLEEAPIDSDFEDEEEQDDEDEEF